MLCKLKSLLKKGTLRNFRAKRFKRILFSLWEKRVCINENCFHLDALKIFTLCSSFNEMHCSHETKSRIFKNLNLRKQADHNFGDNFRKKNHFKHLKMYSNTPSWLARSLCHMGTFWKTKDCTLHFWESQTFRFGTWKFTAKEDLIPQEQVFLLNLSFWRT